MMSIHERFAPPSAAPAALPLCPPFTRTITLTQILVRALQFLSTGFWAGVGMLYWNTRQYWFTRILFWVCYLSFCLVLSYPFHCFLESCVRAVKGFVAELMPEGSPRVGIKVEIHDKGDVPVPLVAISSQELEDRMKDTLSVTEPTLETLKLVGKTTPGKKKVVAAKKKTTQQFTLAPGRHQTTVSQPTETKSAKKPGILKKIFGKK